MRGLPPIDVTTSSFLDLSQPLSNWIPGSQVHGPVVLWAEHPFPADYVDGCLISVTHINVAVHLGTHVDAPRHFFAEGKTIEEIPLERFVRPAVTTSMPLEGALPVTADDLRRAVPDELEPGDFLFLYLGFAERATDESYYDHPYLTGDAAEYLLERGISGLGTDTMSPDKPVPLREFGFAFPVHQALLRADVLIFENLGSRLAEIVGRRVLVAAVPLPSSCDGSLVAPFAIVPEDRA